MNAQDTTGNVNLVEVKLEIDESKSELPEENEKPNTRRCEGGPRRCYEGALRRCQLF